MFEAALGAAFVAGLAGGVHCAGMCGGIIGALGGFARPPNTPAAIHQLFAYNAGRIASYAVAGALVGALGEAGLLTRAAPALRPLMLALGSLMLVVLGLYLAGKETVVGRLESAGAWVWRGIAPLTRHLLPATSPARALALGVLWGWLPCGMVYAVLLTALALGSSAQGALLLIAFGLGTLPNLLGIGFLWGGISRWRDARMPRIAAGYAIAAVGVYGLIKALLRAA